MSDFKKLLGQKDSKNKKIKRLNAGKTCRDN